MLVHEKRFLASVIDVGVVSVVALILNFAIPVGILPKDFTFLIYFLLVNVLYMVISLMVSKDRTLGLYCMSLRLLSDKLDKASVKSIVIRSFVHGVLVLHVLNAFYMFLNKSDISFFDVISDTVIVKTGDTFEIENNK